MVRGLGVILTPCARTGSTLSVQFTDTDFNAQTIYIFAISYDRILAFLNPDPVRGLGQNTQVRG